MVKLKAKDAFYADDVKQVVPGAVFETSEQHAQQLVAAGLAEVQEDASAPPAAAKRAKRARKA